MHISDYGYTAPSDYSPCLPARVVGEHRGRYQIVCDAGAGFATLRGGAYYYGGETFPTVGDFVLLAWQQAGDSAIMRTLPRRSCFARRDPTPGRVAQAVAANFDTVLVAQSLNQDFNLSRLERTLALALQSGGAPVILLTKADLCADAQPYLAAVRQRFPDVPALAVSAATGAGMAGLAPYLAPGRTLVILGSSGVGKSSLINALLGQDAQATAAIRAQDGKGRHTTTARQLLMLPGGAMIIDTPGMREMGLLFAREGLRDSFAPVEELIGRCRFSNCTHTCEPGCAVRAALASGTLDAGLWQRYQALTAESDRAAQLAAKHEKNEANCQVQPQEPAVRGRGGRGERGKRYFLGAQESAKEGCVRRKSQADKTGRRHCRPPVAGG